MVLDTSGSMTNEEKLVIGRVFHSGKIKEKIEIFIELFENQNQKTLW